MVKNKTLTELTNQCVQCGLCLPHCPTYQLTQSENESPRGRIALIKAVNEAQLSLDNDITQYLNHCLQCQACEAMCPSKVEYSTLFITARNTFLPQKLPYIIRFLLQHKRMSFILNYLYQKSGVQWLIRKSAILKIVKLKKDDALLLPLPWRMNLKNHTLQKEKKTVALFTGCMSPIFDRLTLQSAIFLLENLQFNVLLPKNQQCCGALHEHAGDHTAFMALQKNNLKTLQQDDYDFITYCVTGCGGSLQRYQDQSFQEKLIAINTLINNAIHHQKIKFKPLPKNVVLHLPCSERNIIKQAQATKQLLQHIPQLHIQKIINEGCCGAAGSYMLNQPNISQALAQNLLSTIPPDCDYIISSNIGCAMQLQQACNLAQRKIKILHPITLLARQWLSCSPHTT